MSGDFRLFAAALARLRQVFLDGEQLRDERGGAARCLDGWDAQARLRKRSVRGISALTFE